MDVDIVTEHVAMRPEWHDTIDAWLRNCRRRHPDVAAVDFVLSHADDEPAGEAVELVAITGGRSLHADARATDMGTALYDALDLLERELALNEALQPPRRLQ